MRGDEFVSADKLVAVLYLIKKLSSHLLDLALQPGLDAIEKYLTVMGPVPKTLDE